MPTRGELAEDLARLVGVVRPRRPAPPGLPSAPAAGPLATAVPVDATCGSTSRVTGTGASGSLRRLTASPARAIRSSVVSAARRPLRAPCLEVVNESRAAAHGVDRGLLRLVSLRRRGVSRVPPSEALSSLVPSPAAAESSSPSRKKLSWPTSPFSTAAASWSLATCGAASLAVSPPSRPIHTPEKNAATRHSSRTTKILTICECVRAICVPARFSGFGHQTLLRTQQPLV